MCSHSWWARCCIPTAVCMHLCGPTHTINPPPPLPSQRAHSHASIQGIHCPRALLYVHTVSGPTTELSQQFACSSTGPLICFTPPPPHPHHLSRPTAMFPFGTFTVMILFPHRSILLFTHTRCLLTWRGRRHSHINTSYLFICTLSSFCFLDLSMDIANS